MPVMRTTSGGKPAYKYGEGGKPYTYTAGDAASRKAAKAKAVKQGRAIEQPKSERRGQ